MYGFYPGDGLPQILIVSSTAGIIIVYQFKTIMKQLRLTCWVIISIPPYRILRNLLILIDPQQRCLPLSELLAEAFLCIYARNWSAWSTKYFLLSMIYDFVLFCLVFSPFSVLLCYLRSPQDLVSLDLFVIAQYWRQILSFHVLFFF